MGSNLTFINKFISDSKKGLLTIIFIDELCAIPIILKLVWLVPLF